MKNIKLLMVGGVFFVANTAHAIPTPGKEHTIEAERFQAQVLAETADRLVEEIEDWEKSLWQKATREKQGGTVTEAEKGLLLYQLRQLVIKLCTLKEVFKRDGECGPEYVIVALELKKEFDRFEANYANSPVSSWPDALCMKEKKSEPPLIFRWIKQALHRKS